MENRAKINPTTPISWHALPVDEVCAYLSTNPQSGLSPAEAARRLETRGRNELNETPSGCFLTALCSLWKSHLATSGEKHV